MPPCQEIPNVFVHLHTTLITKIKSLFVFWILRLQTPHLSSSPTAALLGMWLPLAVPEATQHLLSMGCLKELKGHMKS